MMSFAEVRTGCRACVTLLRFPRALGVPLSISPSCVQGAVDAWEMMTSLDDEGREEELDFLRLALACSLQIVMRLASIEIPAFLARMGKERQYLCKDEMLDSVGSIDLSRVTTDWVLREHTVISKVAYWIRPPSLRT